MKVPSKAETLAYLERINKMKRTKRTLTHIGVLNKNIGVDSWVAWSESKLYWIDQYGNKYKKVDGNPAGEDYPKSRIFLNTLHNPNTYDYPENQTTQTSPAEKVEAIVS